MFFLERCSENDQAAPRQTLQPLAKHSAQQRIWIVTLGSSVGFNHLGHADAGYGHTLELAVKKLDSREDTLVERAIIKLDALKHDWHFGTVFTCVHAFELGPPLPSRASPVSFSEWSC